MSRSLVHYSLPGTTLSGNLYETKDPETSPGQRGEVSFKNGGMMPKFTYEAVHLGALLAEQGAGLMESAGNEFGEDEVGQ